MKFSDIRPTVETSGELQEQFFSIQDQGMIFDILRNKMYSNPILAICREISCNARDAHREVGMEDVPVEITIPNALEPFYKVRDFGPGISPDRMSNIFIKYTASTKREDNIQTGGFGLGAKTPFSYSDTFTIKTVFNGIEYNYACVIDETKVGKLMTLGESPTTEKNGTEIIVPVKPADFRNFAEWTEFATRHWDVLPIIRGGKFDYKTPTKTISGTGWAVMASNDYNRTVKIIIDGIEYPVDLNALKTYADSAVIGALYGNLYLYFGIGELSLSASREAVYLDKPTQAKISKRIELVVKELKKRVEDKIASLPDLWSANIFFQSELTNSFSNITFLGKLTWQGIELRNRHDSVDCSVYYFQKGGYPRGKGYDSNKIRRGLNNHLVFQNNSALYFNDLPLKEPTPKHVRKIFDTDSNLTSVQVVCANDKVTLDVLKKKYHFDKMGYKLLSSVATATARNYTPATSRLLVFKFDPKAAAFRQVSYSSIDVDSQDKILCKLTRDASANRSAILENKKLISAHIFKGLQELHPKVSFYGIDSDISDDRIAEDFGNLEDFLKENFSDAKKTNFVEIKFAATQSHYVEARLISVAKKLSPMIEDKNSLFLKKIELHNTISKLAQQHDSMLDLYELVAGEISKKDMADYENSNPDRNLPKLQKKIDEKYPLLSAISVYNYEQLCSSIAQYVNLIDKA